MRRAREALRRDREAQIVEDGHVEGDEPLQRALPAAEPNLLALLRTGEGVLGVLGVATHQFIIGSLLHQKAMAYRTEKNAQQDRLDQDIRE